MTDTAASTCSGPAIATTSTSSSLTGRSVWVYGQTEVQKDLIEARTAAGQEIHYEIADTALHDVETDRPCVTFTDAEGRERVVRAEVVVGCDGSFGPSREHVPMDVRRGTGKGSTRTRGSGSSPTSPRRPTS